MTDGIICGISGWFTPHGVRYHEEIRSVSEIAPADWSALLGHAGEIGFFERPEPAPAGPSDRVHHLTITSGERSRELAINDPYETPELARLISLTRRALNDRQVVTSDDERRNGSSPRRQPAKQRGDPHRSLVLGAGLTSFPMTIRLALT